MKRIFIAFGLFWAGIWLVFGIFLFVWHTPYFEQSRHLIDEGRLLQFWQNIAAWENNIIAFFHALVLALLTMVLGTFAEDFAFSEKLKKTLILMQVSGVIISGLCHLAGFMPGMVVGEILVFGVIIVCFIKWMKIIFKQES